MKNIIIWRRQITFKNWVLKQSQKQKNDLLHDYISNLITLLHLYQIIFTKNIY